MKNSGQQTKALLTLGLFILIFLQSPIHAQEMQNSEKSQSTAESIFHHAYFAEHERADFKEAHQLYQKVLQQKGVSEKLRAQAENAMRSCSEELRARDLRSLMQPSSLAYLELNQPGQQLLRLIDQLGLRRALNTAQKKSNVGISDRLVHALLGIRGAAVSVTGFDPIHEKVRGLLVLHLGDVQIARGLIESALPATATAIKPIEGFESYCLENKIYITMTHRLIFVSMQKTSIRNALRRLQDPNKPSLATNGLSFETLGEHKDALLRFGIDFQKVSPILWPLLSAGARKEPELALLLNTCDPQSLKTFSGSLGITATGLKLNIRLDLLQGHQNLVFNGLQLPVLDPQILAAIPANSAAFASLSLNAASAEQLLFKAKGSKTPPIALLDFGRELFANIQGIGLALIPGEKKTEKSELSPFVIVLSSKNIAKSKALWIQLLSLISTIENPKASSQGFNEQPQNIAGHSVRSFSIHHRAKILLASTDHHLALSFDQNALRQCLLTLSGSRTSIIQEKQYQGVLSTLGDSTTLLISGQVGRLLMFFLPHMNPRQQRELSPLLPSFAQSTVSLRCGHSRQHLQLEATLDGVPNIGGWVVEQLIENRQKSARRIGTGRAQLQTNF